MSNYYLVPEYHVPIYDDTGAMCSPITSEAERKLDAHSARFSGLPANYRLCSLGQHTSVHVVFFDLDRGYFLVKARGLTEAYAALRAIDAGFVLIDQWVSEPNAFLPKLLELTRVPRAHWAIPRLEAALSKRSPVSEFGPLQRAELLGGKVVTWHEMCLLGPCIERIYGSRPVSEALCHLRQSLWLFHGLMNDGYYGAHYRHDRRSTSPYEMQRRYLEKRERYELAFLSAFKGIERVLEVNDIKRVEIDRALSRLGHSAIKPDTVYERRHETFSGHEELIAYGQLVRHFLDIRNAVGAHANAAPPDRFWIGEDSLCEIQLFLHELCDTALGEIEPGSLPPRAILRRRNSR